MSPTTVDQAFQLAVRHHQAGQLSQAEALYRQILAQYPKHSGALHLLGVIAHQMGRNDVAADLIRQAIALQPDYSQAYSNLGKVLIEQGQLDEAVVVCRRAIALDPGQPTAHSNLANALLAKGEASEAIGSSRQAIALKPDFPEAHLNLGNALQATGQLDEGIAAYRQAIALNPNYAEAHNNLGNILRDQGHIEEAIAACRQAIALRPGYAEAHNNLGNALEDAGQFDEGIAEYRRAIILKPQFPEACGNLGRALQKNGQLDDAMAAYHQAIHLRLGYAKAYNNLGNALKDTGQLDAAIGAYRQAIALKPESSDFHSNLVYATHFHPGYDAAAIAEEHRRWNDQHAEPLKKFHQPHSNDRDPDRRLRIGYVSPDFRGHVVGRSLLPLLKQHDRRQFEIICYSRVLHPDAFTGQFQQHADGWRNILGLPDETVAARIREDRIDILVDLTLHMAHNRLLVFARKPAPVQVSWLGYPSGTGLGAIDYRLSDPFLDPPEKDDPSCAQQTIRLPDSFQLYDPACEETPVNVLPALERGYVTFGCLNNFCKINEPQLCLWTQILQQTQNSNLMLLTWPGNHRQRTRELLASRGIAPERVIFPDKTPTHSRYLQLYHGIDLSLDPYPYNGHTTSMDSLWMGVPVVSLYGPFPVSRAGLSQASNLGLRDLVTNRPDEYVRIAVELAGDLQRLMDLRGNLRQMMRQSPLMDAPRFAGNIESAYRQMWRKWCATSEQ